MGLILPKGPEFVPGSKTCRRCEQAKPFTEFGTRAVGGKRYPQPYCRACATQYVQARRKTPVGKETLRRYDARKYIRIPHKVRARQAARDAVAAGRLAKGPCEVGTGCKGGVEGHHEDHMKPLAVRWLCRKHHAEADALLPSSSLSSPQAVTPCPICGDEMDWNRCVYCDHRYVPLAHCDECGDTRGEWRCTKADAGLHPETVSP